MDDDDYHQCWMSETGGSLLKQDDGEKLRSRKYIVHNLTQAAS